MLQNKLLDSRTQRFASIIGLMLCFFLPSGAVQATNHFCESYYSGHWSHVDQNGRKLAGGIQIKNEDCGGGKNPKVKVHVFDPDKGGCSDTWVTVNKGATEIKRNLYSYNSKFGSPYEDLKSAHCLYAHEAEGTVGGNADVDGRLNSNYANNRVTCRADWAGVCQCIND